jgi:hypothetical protein
MKKGARWNSTYTCKFTSLSEASKWTLLRRTTTGLGHSWCLKICGWWLFFLSLFFFNRKALEAKFVVYVEGTLLYSWLSFLEIGSDIMPIPQGWEGSYAYFTLGVRTPPLLTSRHKNPPIHIPHDLHRFG